MLCVKKVGASKQTSFFSNTFSYLFYFIKQRVNEGREGESERVSEEIGKHSHEDKSNWHMSN
jgi:hypothetical protein